MAGLSNGGALSTGPNTGIWSGAAGLSPGGGGSGENYDIWLENGIDFLLLEDGATVFELEVGP